ncbi:uncharacterized protein LOC105393553 isoform X1 [Plutella xylostella]|uniref:uncharacterized protein LOC105393553 isoform X1 n=2 Tax=Plutella xylostella TaxID=51655 RepID=UPI002032356C|nr:uncharacterized protein LOC105393553 isoform X1 [Plutella xylostella]
MVQCSSSLSVAVLCFSIVNGVLSKSQPLVEVDDSLHKAKIQMEDYELDHGSPSKYWDISNTQEPEKDSRAEEKALSKVFRTENFLRKQGPAAPIEESSDVIEGNHHDDDKDIGEPDDFEVRRRRTSHFLRSRLNERRSHLETVRRTKLNSQSKINHLEHVNKIQY